MCSYQYHTGWRRYRDRFSTWQTQVLSIQCIECAVQRNWAVLKEIIILYCLSVVCEFVAGKEFLRHGDVAAAAIARSSRLVASIAPREQQTRLDSAFAPFILFYFLLDLPVSFAASSSNHSRISILSTLLYLALRLSILNFEKHI